MCICISECVKESYRLLHQRCAWHVWYFFQVPTFLFLLFYTFSLCANWKLAGYNLQRDKDLSKDGKRGEKKWKHLVVFRILSKIMLSCRGVDGRGFSAYVHKNMNIRLFFVCGITLSKLENLINKFIFVQRD